jgi:glycosyltransferase involved in cell wall biosynthesis
MISIIIRTYNRAVTLERTIKSILAQDFSDLEIIIVNDGSIDNTLEIIAKINDPRLRIINHERNMGMAVAFHTGLDNVKGEWFTLLDSDDEMLPNALSTMIGVPLKINPKIDAVTCNCIDSVTGRLSGLGLEKDQYLDSKTIIQKCRGEFWGITKSVLLPTRKNEQYLASVWHRINKVATRYYIHQGLRIYHTEGNDRYSVSSQHQSSGKNIRRYNTFISILNDKDLLADYKRWGKDFYRDLQFSMGIFFIEYGDRKKALHCIKQLLLTSKSKIKLLILSAGFVFGSKTYYRLKDFKKRYLKKII